MLFGRGESSIWAITASWPSRSGVMGVRRGAVGVLLPAGGGGRLRFMDLKDMSPTVRPALFSGAVAAVCAVAVALAVVAATRPSVVAAPAALPQSTAGFTPSVLSSGDAQVSAKTDTAILTTRVESLQTTTAGGP